MKTTIPMLLSAVIAAFSVTTAVMAQNAGGRSAPAIDGNRANGLNYQPTPQQVAPREQAAGVQPPAAQQQSANRDLERMDKDLMRKERVSTQTVPKMTTDPGNTQGTTR